MTYLYILDILNIYIILHLIIFFVFGLAPLFIHNWEAKRQLNGMRRNSV